MLSEETEKKLWWVKVLLILITYFISPTTSSAQSLSNYFANYKTQGQVIRNKMKLDKLIVDDSLQTVTVRANAAFGEQMFTPEGVSKTYQDIRALLHDSLQTWPLRIETGGYDIHDLVANYRREQPDQARTWGSIDYQGKPWVKDASRPYSISRGLDNRHFCVWASHGIYYNISKDQWTWQRPPLFCTSEDLFTQTIVTPYLIPMLEKAGAVVFTPRERDWQKHEVIVDNDSTATGYSE